ncbi:MAG: hypothetical protein VB086_06860 [Clostridiaceae bacterium]|nr:hypothetical protein [Clostridiaceae bacterium]
MTAQGCITGVAASVAAALGIDPPHLAEKADGRITALLGGRTVGRVLLYNPDAVALWIYEKYRAKFAPLQPLALSALPMTSVMPSVTPVCFASMYTGALPEIHGIRTYVKPVLTCDTLFDAALRAGLRVALVSTEGDSISKIFLNRAMDYYIYKTPEECNAKAEELLTQDRYDLLTVYNGDYDANMHRCGPEGAAALDALDANVAAFLRLSAAAKSGWKGTPGLLCFAPDHGCHEIDGNLGSHGLDMLEDMNVIHFYAAV